MARTAINAEPPDFSGGERVDAIESRTGVSWAIGEGNAVTGLICTRK